MEKQHFLSSWRRQVSRPTLWFTPSLQSPPPRYPHFQTQQTYVRSATLILHPTNNHSRLPVGPLPSSSTHDSLTRLSQGPLASPINPPSRLRDRKSTPSSQLPPTIASLLQSPWPTRHQHSFPSRTGTLRCRVARGPSRSSKLATSSVSYAMSLRRGLHRQAQRARRCRQQFRDIGLAPSSASWLRRPRQHSCELEWLEGQYVMIQK